MPTGSVVVQVITLIGACAGLSSPFYIRWQRKKLASEANVLDADAASKLSAAALELLQPAQEQARYLNSELGKANQEVARLRTALEESQAEATSLRTQMSQMGKEIARQQEEINELRGGT